MPVPLKVSDRLLALAREEARHTHRSATAQIEHWATLGRAVEVLAAYRDVLALKRAGEVLSLPVFVSREEVRARLAALVDDPDREAMKARIRAKGTPVYQADPDRPGKVVEVHPDGARTPGTVVNRRFVAARRRPAKRRK